MTHVFNHEGREYQEVQSLRDLQLTSFNNGQIKFNWSVAAGASWNPRLSFFRIRHKIDSFERLIQQTNNLDNSTVLESEKKYQTFYGNQLSASDGVAPTMNLDDSHWQQMEIKINGQTINKQDNYCHQIGALKKRMYPEDKNKTWGKINFEDSEIGDRQSRIIRDGHYNKPRKIGFIDLGQEFSDSVHPGLGQIVVSTSAQQYNAGQIVGLYLDGLSTQSIGVKTGDWIYWAGINNNAPDNGQTQGAARFFTFGQILGTRTVAGATGGASIIYFQTPVQLSLRSTTDVNVSTKLEPGMIYLSINAANVPSLHVKQPEFETLWQPSLGFFGIDEWLPGGEYEVILTPYPEAQHQISAIEIQNPFIRKVKYQIINMHFMYCSREKASSVKQISFGECRCQAKTINTASLSQKQFIINNKVHSITIAYQDNRVNNDQTLLGSKFKIRNGGDEDFELQLTRFFIQYDGKVLPNPIPDIRYIKGQESGYTNELNNTIAGNPTSLALTGTDFLAQRYWETQLYKKYIWDSIETIEEWKDKGAYYHFAWPRTNSQAQEIQVSQEFRSELDREVRPQLLLFEHYQCKYGFDMYQGYITNVKKLA